MTNITYSVVNAMSRLSGSWPDEMDMAHRKKVVTFLSKIVWKNMDTISLSSTSLSQRPEEVTSSELFDLFHDITLEK